MPTGEQLRFVSAFTGEHNLDTYLEAAQIGGRTLSDLMDDLFTPGTGVFNGTLFQFRVNPADFQLQTRAGVFGDNFTGWTNTGQFIFRPRGAHAISTAYERLDTVTYNNALHLCTISHTSAAAAPGANFEVLMSSGASYTRTSFTASAAQTTFAASYTVGALQVYLNGVLLNDTDYTATNGTSVVLGVAAAAGDIVEVMAFIVGNLGVQGIQGIQGPTGPTGPIGTTGATGATGTMTFPAAGIANSTGTAWGTSYTTTGSGTVVSLATSPTLITPVLGTPASGTLSNCTVDGTNAVGFLTIPQNPQVTSYTLVLGDSGKSIFHPSGAAAATYTIPANAAVAFPVGTAVSIINMASAAVTIAITTDTLYLAGTGTTGSRTLALYGVATATKMTSTTWIISGSGLT